MKINKEKVMQSLHNCKSLDEVVKLTGYTETQLYNLAHRDSNFYKPFYDLKKKVKPPKKTKEELKKEAEENEKAQLEKFNKQMADLTKGLPPLEAWKNTKKASKKQEEWVLLFSDFHYGQVVKPIEIGNFAEYNPEKAKERLMYLSKTLQHLTKYHTNPPEVLNIFFLGDMIDSVILRASQLATTEFGLVKQIIGCIALLSEFLVSLTGSFKKINCYGVGGNHSRITKSFSDSVAQDNFDILIYEMVKQKVANIKKISITYPESTHMIVQIQKHKFWLEHGDTLRSWLGLPFYGANREKGSIQGLLNIFSQGIDYLTIGHFHQYAYFNDIIMNGSFVGGDGYSVGRLRRMCVPEQVLFGITEKYGIVWKRPIKLEVKSKLTKPLIYGGD